MKHSARLKKSTSVLLAVMLFLSALFVTGPDSRASASVLNAPKMDIISDGAPPIGPEYSFVPQFTASSKVIPFGSTLWRTTQWSSGDARKFHSIEVTNPTNRDDLKNKIGVRYTNVGSYQGQTVDLKITVTNWNRYGNPGKSGTAARVGNISFEDRKIAMSTQGYNFVDTTWEYMKAGTETPVYVAGYFTYSDIDLYQGLQFSPITSQNIERYLIEDRRNLLQFGTVTNTSGTQHKFYDTTDIDRPDQTFDSRHAFTFLYKNLRSFSLRWYTNWYQTDNAAIRGGDMTPNRYYYTNTRDYAVGEYLFFVINKPGDNLPPPKPKPDMDMIQIYTNNVKNAKVPGLRTIVDVGAFTGVMSADDYDSPNATFEVFDRSNDRKVYSTTFHVEKLPPSHEFRMPADYLAKGAKTQYEFKLTIPKKKTQYYWYYYYVNQVEYYWFDDDNDPNTPDVQGSRVVRVQERERRPVLPIPVPTPISMFSHGYTSSEKNFTYADLDAGEIDYTGVIKTIKGKTTPVIELEERTTIKFPTLPTQKTGYAFGPSMSATYMNELKETETIKSEFLIDRRLIDSYVDYPDKGVFEAIPLEDTLNRVSTNQETMSMRLTLPFVHVERNTGHLFTNKSDARIKQGIAGSARKLYAPIWADIKPTKPYEYRYATTEPIGVHDITYDIQNVSKYNLKFSAYMYNHADSNTTDDDELLIHPIRQDDVPEEWTLGTAE